MRSRALRATTWIGIAAVCLVSSARAADPGDTTAQFLKIGVGAQAAAMGEAYVAVAQDATALYWNPAGIANARGRELHASHNEWISDVRYEYVAMVQGLKGHAFGVHAGLLHQGEFDGRDATGNFTGSFRAYDFVTGLSYGRRVLRSVELGLTGKVVYSKIQDYTANAFAVDFGIRYRTPIRGLTMAATATNLGSEMKFIEEAAVLPAAARFGLAYRTRAVLSGLVVAADARFPNDHDPTGHVGAELWVHDVISLRGGTKLNADEEAGAFGFGIKYSDYVIDYAFVPFAESSELGDTHRLSFGWRPGAYEE